MIMEYILILWIAAGAGLGMTSVEMPSLSICESVLAQAEKQRSIGGMCVQKRPLPLKAK